VAGIYAAVQLVCLVLWSAAPGIQEARPSTTIPSAVLSFVSALAILLLSYYEHRRSIRPSVLLASFLFLTFLLDAVVLRTLWLRGRDTALVIAFTVGFAVKGALLVLEAQTKAHQLPDKTAYGLEATSGPFNITLFWWLNRLFLKGFGHNLEIEDLSKLEDEFSSSDLEHHMRHAWESGKSAFPSRTYQAGLSHEANISESWAPKSAFLRHLFHP
jgi:ATP-binding cassette, subfamily C (CFTR/MRP), member 1